MFRLSFMLQCLEGKLTKNQTLAFNRLSDRVCVMLWRADSVLSEGVIHIARYKEVSLVMQSITKDMHGTIMFSECPNNCELLTDAEGVNLISTTLTVSQLTQEVNIIVKHYSDVQDELLSAAAAEFSQKNLMKAMHELTGYDVCLLDRNKRLLLFEVGEQPLPVTRIILDNMGFPLELRANVLKGAVAKRSPNPTAMYCTLPEAGVCLHTKTYINRSGLENEIIIVKDSEASVYDAVNICYQLARLFVNMTPQEHAEPNQAFFQLLKLAVEDRQMDPVQLEHAYDILQFPVSRDNLVMVVNITFPGRDRTWIPFSSYIKDLEEIFPGTNITAFHNSIVMLYQTETYQGAAVKLMENVLFRDFALKNGMAVGLSNPSRHHHMLFTLYKQSLKAAQAGLLWQDREGPFYCYSDYLSYDMVDLIYCGLKEDYGHDDLMYIVNRSMFSLLRFDEEHQTNYRDILFKYLLNDCNTKKTAAALFMHRNTLQKKIAQIMEIMQEDLSSERTRCELFYSCLLINYYEKYLKRTIKI